jgi:hypothetical protein
MCPSIALFYIFTFKMISLEYNKKKDKKARIKFVKNEAITKDGVYKSHTVSIASGESPSSVSRPPAKRKPGVVRPITQGKLLKAGGPSKVKGFIILHVRLKTHNLFRRL